MWKYNSFNRLQITQMADYCENGNKCNSLLTTKPVLDFLGFCSMVQFKYMSISLDLLITILAIIKSDCTI